MAPTTPTKKNIKALWLLAAALLLGSSARALGDELTSAYSSLREQTRALKQARRASIPEPTAEIVLFGTNDIHGSLGPLPADAKKGLPASGGAASLATVFKEESRPYLWLDAGDWFQGTPEGNLSRGDVVVEMFNELGLTAGVIGNHEYDYGSENVDRLAAKARFPLLGANIVSDRSGRAPSYIKPYIVRKFPGGVVVGIFGLTTRSMKTLAFPKNIEGLSFSEETAAAQAIVERLRKKEKATIVVAVTHMGIEGYGEKSSGIAAGDINLAKTVPGIDVILGGHTHTRMAKPVIVEANGGKTLITQTGGSLRSVYRVVLKTQGKKGRLIDVQAELLDLDPARYAPDPHVAGIVAAQKAAVDAQMGAVISAASVDMANGGNGGFETAAGAWVAGVLKRRGGVDIGIINTFGVRAGLRQGPLTHGDIYRVAPFDDIVTTIKIRGSELKKLVEKNLGADISTLQYSGVEIAYDAAAPAGQRMTGILVGGAAVEDEKVYTAASVEFVIKVDAAFKGVEVQEPVVLEHVLRDWLIEEAKNNSPIGPTAAALRVVL